MPFASIHATDLGYQTVPYPRFIPMHLHTLVVLCDSLFMSQCRLLEVHHPSHYPSNRSMKALLPDPDLEVICLVIRAHTNLLHVLDFIIKYHARDLSSTHSE